MGIIFKKYRKDSYCEKCETTFYKQCDAFSELEDRPLKCPKCGAVLFYIDGYYYMADYYMLRGTNLKISATFFCKDIQKILHYFNGHSPSFDLHVGNGCIYVCCDRCIEECPSNSDVVEAL